MSQASSATSGNNEAECYVVIINGEQVEKGNNTEENDSQDRQEAEIEKEQNAAATKFKDDCHVYAATPQNPAQLSSADGDIYVAPNSQGVHQVVNDAISKADQNDELTFIINTGGDRNHIPTSDGKIPANELADKIRGSEAAKATVYVQGHSSDMQRRFKGDEIAYISEKSQRGKHSHFWRSRKNADEIPDADQDGVGDYEDGLAHQKAQRNSAATYYQVGPAYSDRGSEILEANLIAGLTIATTPDELKSELKLKDEQLAVVFYLTDTGDKAEEREALLNAKAQAEQGRYKFIVVKPEDGDFSKFPKKPSTRHAWLYGAELPKSGVKIQGGRDFTQQDLLNTRNQGRIDVLVDEIAKESPNWEKINNIIEKGNRGSLLVPIFKALSKAIKKALEKDSRRKNWSGVKLTFEKAFELRKSYKDDESAKPLGTMLKGFMIKTWPRAIRDQGWNLVETFIDKFKYLSDKDKKKVPLDLLGKTMARLNVDEASLIPEHLLITALYYTTENQRASVKIFKHIAARLTADQRSETLEEEIIDIIDGETHEGTIAGYCNILLEIDAKYLSPDLLKKMFESSINDELSLAAFKKLIDKTDDPKTTKTIREVIEHVANPKNLASNELRDGMAEAFYQVQKNFADKTLLNDVILAAATPGVFVDGYLLLLKNPEADTSKIEKAFSAILDDSKVHGDDKNILCQRLLDQLPSENLPISLLKIITLDVPSYKITVDAFERLVQKWQADDAILEIFKEMNPASKEDLWPEDVRNQMANDYFDLAELPNPKILTHAIQTAASAELKLEGYILLIKQEGANTTKADEEIITLLEENDTELEANCAALLRHKKRLPVSILQSIVTESLNPDQTSKAFKTLLDKNAQAAVIQIFNDAINAKNNWVEPKYRDAIAKVFFENHQGWGDRLMLMAIEVAMSPKLKAEGYEILYTNYNLARAQEKYAGLESWLGRDFSQIIIEQKASIPYLGHGSAAALAMHLYFSPIFEMFSDDEEKGLGKEAELSMSMVRALNKNDWSDVYFLLWGATTLYDEEKTSRKGRKEHIDELAGLIFNHANFEAHEVPNYLLVKIANYATDPTLSLKALEILQSKRQKGDPKDSITSDIKSILAHAHQQKDTKRLEAYCEQLLQNDAGLYAENIHTYRKELNNIFKFSPNRNHKIKAFTYLASHTTTQANAKHLAKEEQDATLKEELNNRLKDLGLIE